MAPDHKEDHKEEADQLTGLFLTDKKKQTKQKGPNGLKVDSSRRRLSGYFFFFICLVFMLTFYFSFRCFNLEQCVQGVQKQAPR